MRFLQALFPEASFVASLRHPVAVAYATAEVAEEGVAADARCATGSSRTRSTGRTRPSSTGCSRCASRTSYATPDAVLARVYGFLGLEPRPTSLEIRPDANEAYFRRWREEEESVAGRLRHRLLRRELEERVGAFGYSLGDLELSGAASAGALPS